MLVWLIAFGILQMFVQIPNGARICLDILTVFLFFLSIFSGGDDRRSWFTSGPSSSR